LYWSAGHRSDFDAEVFVPTSSPESRQNRIQPKDIFEMAFQLVAIDVDGTLLHSNKNVPDENVRAVRRAEENGLPITLVTGRSIFSLRHILKRLNLNTPYIGSGGAIIAHPRTEEILDYRALDRQDLEIVVSVARDLQVAQFFYMPDGIYYEATPEMLRGWSHSNTYEPIKVSDALSELEGAPTKLAIYGDKARLQRVEQAITERDVQVHVSYPHDYFIDVTRRDADKGKALLRLADRLGISPDVILAVGDADNDLTMFRVAGAAVAMGNAPPEVQVAADYIAPTNDENGLAWLIDRLIEARQTA
jgi:Cof subfamily protein (haloacid dehalogenase superfamily)